MTNLNEYDYQQSQGEDAVPYEAIPQLAADEDFIRKATRLRELKEIKDRVFRPAKGNDAGGEWEQLKLELGARAMAAGVKTVTFHDLRITNAEGGETAGELTGLHIQNAAEALSMDLDEADWRCIAISALKLDIKQMLKLKIPVKLIEAAKSLITGKARSASVRVDWVGRKGSGGPVQ